MKTRILPIMLCIVFISCIWIADASAEQDYPMVCKGGGNMNLQIAIEEKSIQINFAKSPQPSSRQEPAPGTCAWVDRPLSPQEPTHMTFAFEKRPEYMDIRQQNITMSLAAGNIADGNLRYLVDGVYNGKVFYVRCYQHESHGMRWFKISRIGP